MFPPTQTGSGESVLVTATSACAITVVVVVLELLDVLLSGVGLATVVVLVIVVLCVVLTSTLTTMVKTAVSPATVVALENTTLPVPPTAGAEVLQPVPVVTVAETNVVFAGTASVTVTVCASDGPLLMKFTV